MLQPKKYFFKGYSRTVGRTGDLYVTPTDTAWHINAGVSPSGHDPGFGVWCDIAYDSPEMGDFAKFMEKTTQIQNFITEELGSGTDSCEEIFEEIWTYLHEKELRHE